MSAPLLHLVNLSFSQGVVPNHVKLAHVTPIYKAGDRQMAGNYRPISVLSVLAKLLEKLMYNRLYTYLIDHGVLISRQFGFRRGFSTEMALTVALDLITSALDEKKHVLGLFIDLRKAFDTVNSQILLSKLCHYGVRGVVHDWFSSYLSSRRQRVKIDGFLSDINSLSCGVPQGSTLGPLLFLVYINDLPNVLDTITPILFADDTSLFLKGDNIDSMVYTFNSQLKHLLSWLRANELSLNLSKTYSVLFSLSPHVRSLTVDIRIENTPIERIHATRFLGVIIDDQLSWSPHISHVANKVSKSIGILNKVKYVLNTDTLVMLYYSLIYPYFFYCHLIWGKAAYSSLRQLIILQKKAVRVLSRSSFYAHTAPLFSQHKILHLEDLYIYCSSIYAYKLTCSIFPTQFLEIFNPLSEQSLPSSSSSTRNSSSRSIRLPYCRTSTRQKFLYYQLSKTFLEFLQPLNIIEDSHSVHTFKSKVKKILQ